MTFISENNLAALAATSVSVVRSWGNRGVFPQHFKNGVRGFMRKNWQPFLRWRR